MEHSLARRMGHLATILNSCDLDSGTRHPRDVPNDARSQGLQGSAQHAVMWAPWLGEVSVGEETLFI